VTQCRAAVPGTWLLLVSGGGPTADKPSAVFAPPADVNQVSHSMTLRVASGMTEAGSGLAGAHTRQFCGHQGFRDNEPMAVQNGG
jgi:hypothetical protein